MKVKPRLSIAGINGKAFRMSEDGRNDLSREERLAAKLRENLRRRKAQSRAMEEEPGESDTALPKSGGGG